MGKNGDKKLAQYREDNAPTEDPAEKVQEYLDLQNKQNGLLTPSQRKELQKWEALVNQEKENNRLYYDAPTNYSGSSEFGDRFEPVTLQGMVASSNFENIMTKMMEYYASPMRCLI